MCMSPHEMTSARIEAALVGMNHWIKEFEESGDQSNANFWCGRRDGYEAILKERAENGTYATAGLK